MGRNPQVGNSLSIAEGIAVPRPGGVWGLGGLGQCELENGGDALQFGHSCMSSTENSACNTFSLNE